MHASCLLSETGDTLAWTLDHGGTLKMQNPGRTGQQPCDMWLGLREKALTGEEVRGTGTDGEMTTVNKGA